jgi:hypothetical protein
MRACMRVCIVAFVALLLVSPSSATPPDAARAWQDDLRFMVREMERTHKNLYHAISREEFAAMVAALNVKIPSLERHEVIVEMAKIVAAVGDGHTNIYPTRDPKIGFRMLPVAFTFFGDELYVRAAHESQRSLVGARVLRLGDRDTGDAYAAVKTMIGRDNERGARYWAQYLLAMPEVLHALRITHSPDDVPLTLATSRGEESVVLHPFAPVEIMSGDTATLFNRRDGWIDVRDLSGRPDPLWLRSDGDAFHFEHAGNLLYVQINKVGDKADETLAHFAQRLHDEIAATKPDKVAIDLRLNRGGDGTLVIPVIRALIQSESIDRKGHLFAITGPATFSAAQGFADALEKYTNVTFVGEPTGSKGNAYGDSRKITLPNSGITVRASIYYWQDWHPMDKRDATIPQIPAPLMFDTYRNNIDPALEAIERASADEVGP